MGRHITPDELDEMFAWQAAGNDPLTIHKKLAAARRRCRQPEPDVTTVRRALKAKTFKRGKKETRGRKKMLSDREGSREDQGGVDSEGGWPA